jgi:diaminopimelate epimerase
MRLEKWHGAGNDFLVADGRRPEPAGGWSAWAARVCERRRGIGADGLLVLRANQARELSMLYWNADGSRAEMCGNGGRVLAAFAFERGLGAAGEVRFDSPWGSHRARVEREAPHRYHVHLSLPDVPAATPLRVLAPWGEAEALFVVPGVPHLVLRAEVTPARRVRDVPVAEWGGLFRRQKLPGGAGANVDFVEHEGGSRLAVRTYERGVEGETLACGTGAVAAAAAAEAWGLGDPPWEVTPWSGERLRVCFRRSSGALRDVSLSGPAVRVGTIELPEP